MENTLYGLYSNIFEDPIQYCSHVLRALTNYQVGKRSYNLRIHNGFCVLDVRTRVLYSCKCMQSL